MLRKIELLDDAVLLRQLRNLREGKSPRGQIDVRPSSGKDDTAVAVALAVHQAITQLPPLPFDSMPFDLRPSLASLGMIPDRCPMQLDVGIFQPALISATAWGLKVQPYLPPWRAE
jgi:hypothetical protein